MYVGPTYIVHFKVFFFVYAVLLYDLQSNEKKYICLYVFYGEFRRWRFDCKLTAI